MDPMIREFVCAELGVGQVKFEGVSEGSHKVCLLLQAG